jgi:type I restriction enzyme, S subunit
MKIPEGWKTQKLSKISSIKRGAGSQYLKYVEDSENGIRLIRIGDFLGDNKKYVEYSEDMNRFILQKGDLLIAGTGATAGITFEVPDSFVGYAFSYNAPRIRPHADQNKKYIIYALKSQSILRQQHALFTGNAQPFLDTKAIGGFGILLPPPLEQKKIAEILSTWDRAIEVVEGLIENSQAQKKALMQQLLTGKKRLPGFDGEWEVSDIKKMGIVSSGGTPSSDNPDYWGGEIFWATPTDITALTNKTIASTKRKITAKGLSNSSAKLLPKGSLLICTRATIGYSAISAKPISTNQGFKNLTPNSMFDIEFLYYLFQHLKHVFIRYACGSTFLELSKKDFEKREFLTPAREEQCAISAILSDADLEIEAQTQQLTQLKSEKSALMQQLLTGKRRVKIDKEAAA